MAKTIAGAVRLVLTILSLALTGMLGAHTALAQPTKSYETTAEVPLREGPGNFHKVITTLPKGIKINVVSKEGNWLKVESKHGSKPGYIDDQFARASSTATTPAAQSTVAANVAGPYRTLREQDLRESPSANARVVTRIPTDIKVNVTRAEGDWLRVESKRGGKPGYVEKRDVERWRDR